MKKSMQTLHVSLVAAGLLLLLVPTSLAQRTVSDNGTADSRSLEQLRVERASLVKLRDLFRSGDYFPVQGVGGFSGWVKTEDAVNLALVSCLARKDPCAQEVAEFVAGRARALGAYAAILTQEIQKLDNLIEELELAGSDPNEPSELDTADVVAHTALLEGTWNVEIRSEEGSVRSGSWYVENVHRPPSAPAVANLVDDSRFDVTAYIGRSSGVAVDLKGEFTNGDPVAVVPGGRVSFSGTEDGALEWTLTGSFSDRRLMVGRFDVWSTSEGRVIERGTWRATRP